MYEKAAHYKTTFSRMLKAQISTWRYQSIESIHLHIMYLNNVACMRPELPLTSLFTSLLYHYHVQWMASNKAKDEVPHIIVQFHLPESVQRAK
eukprot:1143192-Pelagomonas_calceolata.AAC.7